MNAKIFKYVSDDILIDCYTNVTPVHNIHDAFKKIEFRNPEDRVLLYETYAKIMLKKCMATHGVDKLIDWNFDINKRLVTTGGLCNFTKKNISIANWLIINDLTKFDDIRDTILHEIAHANAWIKYRDKTHGAKWVAEAKRIGCTGIRCMPVKFSESLFEKATYLCRNPTDKCVCAKVGRKTALLTFSKKVPKLMCKKHGLLFDYIDTKPYTHEFGTSKDFVYVDDGDIVELGPDGNFYKIEETECRLFD